MIWTATITYFLLPSTAALLVSLMPFLKGLFSETLPTAPIDRLALTRLDGDMYESTMDALTALYDKLSPGGYVLIDDYGLDGCKAAVDDFRSERTIQEPMTSVDWSGVTWRKSL